MSQLWRSVYQAHRKKVAQEKWEHPRDADNTLAISMFGKQTNKSAD